MRTPLPTLLAPAALLLASLVTPQEPESPTFIPPLRLTSMTGTVVDADGAPVAGATVQVSGIEVYKDGSWQREIKLGLMPSFTTDADGLFEIPLSDSRELRYDLWAERHDFAPSFVRAVSTKSEPPRIVLQHGVEVRGMVSRLTDAGAGALPGLQVAVQHPTADLWFVRHAMTDNDGRYSARIPADRDGHWSVRVLGEQVELPRGQGDDRAPVEGPSFEISVRVLARTDGGEEGPF